MHKGEYKGEAILAPQQKVLRVAYYIRVSTSEQVSKENSLPAQKIALDEYASAHGMKCVGVYADEGKTAAKEIRRRKAIHAMLADIEAGKIDLVIFTRFDRFTRNPTEYFKIMETFDKAGVQWKATMQQELDLNTDMGQTLILFYLGMGRQEIANISERIKATAAVRIQKKLPISGAQNMPIGYTIGTDEKGQKIVAKDPEMEPVVWAYINHFELHHSKRAAMLHANELFGLNLRYRTYSRILENTLYYGHYRGVDDYCEPYVTKERHENWKRIGIKNVWKRENARSYIFTSLIRCPSCGCLCTGNAIEKKTVAGESYFYYYYRCTKAVSYKLCDYRRNFSENKVEKYLLNHIHEEIERYISQLELESKEPVKKAKVDIGKLEAELERVNYQFQKNRINVETYDKKYDEIMAKIAEATKDEEPQPQERNLQPLRDFLKIDLASIYPTMTRDEKRALWRSVISEIEIEDGKFKAKFF